MRDEDGEEQDFSGEPKSSSSADDGFVVWLLVLDHRWSLRDSQDDVGSEKIVCVDGDSTGEASKRAGRYCSCRNV